MKKLLVLISTAEKEKALTGLLYSLNALKRNWYEDVKVYFMGPIEKLITQDQDIQEQMKALFEFKPPVACKFVSEKENITEELEALGYQLEYIGQSMTDDINNGYIPMVF